MKQAIVIKNPKWEPFTAASDAFKKSKAEDSAVLIVRGRCKEIRNKMAKAVKVAAAIVLLCLPAAAQQSLISYLPSATANSFSTNLTAGVGIIGINQDQVGTVQVTVSGTNALSTGNVVLRFDNSDNGIDWSSNCCNVTVAILGANASTSISRITNSTGGKWMRIGGIANTGTSTTNTATINRVSLSLKEQ